MLGALVVALLFSQLAVLGAVVLLGLALVVAARGTLRERAAALGGRRRGLGAGMVLVLAAYGVVRAFVAPPATGSGPEVGRSSPGHLRYVLAEAWGGPWSGDLVGHAALVAPTWAVAVGAVLLAASAS